MTGHYKLDRIDIKILAVLQRNGRITNVELADEVNLSPSPCLMRVKKLQQAGYITGYSAQIDLAKLGETLTVFTEFTLKNHRQIDFARFQEALEKIESCVECHLVSGGLRLSGKIRDLRHFGLSVDDRGADRPQCRGGQILQLRCAQDPVRQTADSACASVRRARLAPRAVNTPGPDPHVPEPVGRHVSPA